MESLNFELAGILAPNPMAKRANRVKWSMKPSKDGSDRIIAYAAQKNLIIRDLNDPLKTKVFNNQILNEITCVKYNHDGNYIAIGDDKGGVRVIGWSDAEKNFVVKYQNDGLLAGGQVNDIAFSDDNQKIVVVGAGGQRAKAVNIDTNSNCGELTGHTSTLLCVDIKITKPFKCVLSGEDKEIQVYKGPPFKSEKSIPKIHAGFVTKIAFTPWDECAHFITVSADKSLKIHNTETYETVLEHTGLHSMGINDFCFTANPNEIITCSSDRSAKVWIVNFETKKLDEVTTHNLSEADDKEFTDNVDK